MKSLTPGKFVRLKGCVGGRLADSLLLVVYPGLVSEWVKYKAVDMMYKICNWNAVAES